MASKKVRPVFLVLLAASMASYFILTPLNLGLPPEPVPYVATDLLSAVGTVWHFDTDYGTGSAVVVSSVAYFESDPTLAKFKIVMLTARHVTRYMELMDAKATATRGDDVLEGGVVLATHPEDDLALVVFESDQPYMPAKLRRGSPTLLEKLYSIGYSGGQKEKWVSEGLANGEQRSTGPAAPGDSGGAVVDVKGQLVGIMKALDTIRGRFDGFVYHHMTYESVSDALPWIIRECPTILMSNPDLSDIDPLLFSEEEAEELDEPLEESESPEPAPDETPDPSHVPEEQSAEPSPTPPG